MRAVILGIRGLRVERGGRHGQTIAGSEAGFADGAGAEARFKNPVGIARDAAGNLYVTEPGNSAIRKLTPKS